MSYMPNTTFLFSQKGEKTRCGTKYYQYSRLPLSGVSGLAVALQLLHGDIEQLRREYMVLFTRGVSITRKLGFSDIIMPGEMFSNSFVSM